MIIPPKFHECTAKYISKYIWKMYFTIYFEKLIFIRWFSRTLRRNEMSVRIRWNFAVWSYEIITCEYRLILVYIRCLLLCKGLMENKFIRAKSSDYFDSPFSQTPPSMHTKITLVLCWKNLIKLLQYYNLQRKVISCRERLTSFVTITFNLYIQRWCTCC